MLTLLSTLGLLASENLGVLQVAIESLIDASDSQGCCSDVEHSEGQKLQQQQEHGGAIDI